MNPMDVSRMIARVLDGTRDDYLLADVAAKEQRGFVVVSLYSGEEGQITDTFQLTVASLGGSDQACTSPLGHWWRTSAGCTHCGTLRP